MSAGLKFEIAEAEAKLDELRRRQRDERARRMIECRSCGKLHAINKLALLVTHWYTEPHGCTGGDYWSEGEWQFVCPTKGEVNRLMFDDYHLPYEERYGSKNATYAFKGLYPKVIWASSTDTYDGHVSGCNKNYDCDCVGTKMGRLNYYVDQHRRRFELPEKPEKK